MVVCIFQSGVDGLVAVNVVSVLAYGIAGCHAIYDNRKVEEYDEAMCNFVVAIFVRVHA